MTAYCQRRRYRRDRAEQRHRRRRHAWPAGGSVSTSGRGSFRRELYAKEHANYSLNYSRGFSMVVPVLSPGAPNYSRLLHHHGLRPGQLQAHRRRALYPDRDPRAHARGRVPRGRRVQVERRRLGRERRQRHAAPAPARRRASTSPCRSTIRAPSARTPASSTIRQLTTRASRAAANILIGAQSVCQAKRHQLPERRIRDRSRRQGDRRHRQVQRHDDLGGGGRHGLPGGRHRSDQSGQ